jgi:hypothetical protein
MCLAGRRNLSPVYLSFLLLSWLDLKPQKSKGNKDPADKRKES